MFREGGKKDGLAVVSAFVALRPSNRYGMTRPVLIKFGTVVMPLKSNPVLRVCLSDYPAANNSKGKLSP
jgi:hypothetical protein